MPSLDLVIQTSSHEKKRLRMIHNNTKAVDVPGNPWEEGVQKISGTIMSMDLMDMQSLTINLTCWGFSLHTDNGVGCQTNK